MLRGTVLRIAAVGIAGYSAMAAMVYFNQGSMLYQSDIGRSSSATPADRKLGFEEVWLTTEDGEQIHGWFVPAAENPDSRTVLFFHGNAGNISHRLDVLANWHTLGFDTFIIDYRGYGQSSGTTSEEGTYLDARAAWKYLTEERGVSREKILVVGRSLGSGVATHLAREVDPRGLILEAAFTSVPDVAEEIYWWLPVRQLARFEYDNRSRLAEIDCPILIVHSPQDEIIPFSHAPALLAAANGSARLVRIEGGHNSGYRVSKDIYLTSLQEFVQSVFGPRVETLGSAPE